MCIRDRPEDLRLDEAGGDVEATVKGTQFLGSEYLVDLDLGGPQLLARIEGHGEFGIDQPCRVAIDLSRAHLFHPETGDRL